MGFRTKILIIITLLGACLRFWQLGQLPSSLNWDEIAIGWNAYSILQTGKDEFGVTFPTIFRSFDDYKSPMYIYLTVPAIYLFGKTEFAIRFVSAFAGSLSVLTLYFFTTKLLTSHTTNVTWQNRISNIAVLSSLILAILPWHLHFSRVAFEANLGLFFLLLGSTLLLSWLQHSRTRNLLFAVLCYSGAMYSYANMRLLVCLLLLLFGLQHFKTILQQKKDFFIAGLLGAALSIPLFLQLLGGTGLARYQATSIVNRPHIYEATNLRLQQESNPVLNKLFNNHRLAIFQAFTESYLSHFQFDFLFLQKEASRVTIPGNGLLYLWLLPLILYGSIFVSYNRHQLNATALFALLAIAPVPSGLTWDTPNAIRTEMMVIPLSILSAIGLWGILKFLQKIDLSNYHQTSQNIFLKVFRWVIPKATFFMIGLLITTSVIRWLTNLNTLLTLENASIWLYGRREMVQSVIPLQKEFQTVKISLSLEWSYLWFLWYGNISPQTYLAQGGTRSGGFAFEGNQIDNLQFVNFDYTKDSFQKTGVLYIGTPKDFPQQFVPGQSIETPDGQKLIYIVRS